MTIRRRSLLSGIAGILHTVLLVVLGEGAFERLGVPIDPWLRAQLWIASIVAGVTVGWLVSRVRFRNAGGITLCALSCAIGAVIWPPAVDGNAAQDLRYQCEGIVFVWLLGLGVRAFLAGLFNFRHRETEPSPPRD